MGNWHVLGILHVFVRIWGAFVSLGSSLSTGKCLPCIKSSSVGTRTYFNKLDRVAVRWPIQVRLRVFSLSS